MSAKPISPLRRRMLEDMAVRKFGEKTQHDYIRHIESFAKFLGRSPETATPEDVRRFQVDQTEEGAQPAKMNTQSVKAKCDSSNLSSVGSQSRLCAPSSWRSIRTGS